MWVSISKRLKHLNTVGSGRQGEVTNSIFQDDSIQFKSNLYTGCPIYSLKHMYESREVGLRDYQTVVGDDSPIRECDICSSERCAE